MIRSIAFLFLISMMAGCATGQATRASSYAETSQKNDSSSMRNPAGQVIGDNLGEPILPRVPKLETHHSKNFKIDDLQKAVEYLCSLDQKCIDQFGTD